MVHSTDAEGKWPEALRTAVNEYQARTGLSQQGVAAAAGIRGDLLQGWLRGHVPKPGGSAEALKAIGVAFEDIPEYHHGGQRRYVTPDEDGWGRRIASERFPGHEFRVVAHTLRIQAGLREHPA